MHRAFFTFAAFVTGSKMEGCPGHLVHLVNSASKRCPSSAAISSSSNANSPSSVYPTGRRRLVRHQPSPPSCHRSRTRDRRFRRRLIPPDSVAIRRFSSRPHHIFKVFLKVHHCKISQCLPTKMADVDCIRIFFCIHYPTGRRRIVRHQPSSPSCRRSRFRGRRDRRSHRRLVSAGLCRHPPLL